MQPDGGAVTGSRRIEAHNQVKTQEEGVDSLSFLDLDTF